MEAELGPSVEIQQGTFNVVIAPVEMIVEVLRRMVLSRRFLLLFVCGNCSRLLSRLSLRVAEFDMRRAFTAFQLLNILQEAHHTMLFIEHDPTLYQEAEELAEGVSMALRELVGGSTVMLYAPRPDPFLSQIARRADRLFYIAEKVGARDGSASYRGPGRRRRGVQPRATREGQSRLEAF